MNRIPDLPTPSHVGSRRESLGRWLPLALVVLVTFIVFFPTLENGFIDLDDPENFLDNEHYRGLGPSNLRWMFTTTLTGHWIPLSWITLGADYLLWGMDPAGYHLTNLLLHMGGAIVFYFVAIRLLRMSSTALDLSSIRAGATAAALFFAIHPLRVESVAWITERRDVLSGLWFLLTILTYLKAVDSREERRRWLAVSVVCYAIAAGSKAIVMTLPAVLLILDIYPLRRLRVEWREWLSPTVRRVWREKIPYALIAMVTAGMAIHAQYGLADTLGERSIPERIAVAFYGLWFYVRKTIFPHPISTLYEMPLGIDVLSFPMVGSAVAVGAITIALLLLRRRWPAALTVWAAYVILLSPVSGVSQSGIQLVAPRYSYLSALGFALLAGAAVAFLWRATADGRLRTATASLLLSTTLVGFITLGILTWKHLDVWSGPYAFWSHAVSAGPRSYLGHRNLGLVLFHQGRVGEANEQIAKAMATLEYQRGISAMMHDSRLAIQHFEQALRIDPNFPEAKRSLDIARTRQKR